MEYKQKPRVNVGRNKGDKVIAINSINKRKRIKSLMRKFYQYR